MHVLIWTILGCESRPQPGAPLVLVEAEKGSKFSSEENAQELSSEQGNASNDGKADDDFFSDNSFELSSDQMAKTDDPSVRTGTESEEASKNNTVASPAKIVDEREELEEEELGENLDHSSETQIDLPIVLVDLLDTVPPRAVLMLPGGEEIVVKAGMLLPEHDIVVLAVGTKSATLVKVSAAGDTSNMEPLHLTPLY
mgnify:CR=1 FL=1